MALPRLPDALELTRQALLARSSLAALVSQVSDRVPATGLLGLALSSVYEHELDPHILEARVQVDVWGPGSDSPALGAVRNVQRELLSVTRDMPGVYAAGRVLDVEHVASVPAPDQTSGRHRAVVDLLIHAMT